MDNIDVVYYSIFLVVDHKYLWEIYRGQEKEPLEINNVVVIEILGKFLSKKTSMDQPKNC